MNNWINKITIHFVYKCIISKNISLPQIHYQSNEIIELSFKNTILFFQIKYVLTIR